MPSNNNENKNGFLNSLSKIESSEVKPTILSFTLAMILMASYYILRPVRDAMASDWSDAEVSTLWTINFFFTFVLVSVYSAAASRIKFKWLVPSVYTFFAGTFVVFYMAAEFVGHAVLVDKAFYVWVSLFSLFPLSLFWSFMSDIYSQEQSKRLFGVITTGASVGAMIGPSIPLLFSDLGTENLMLVASLVLLLTLPIILFLNQYSDEQTKATHKDTFGALSSLGGNWLSGFKLFLQNPFLLGIGFFLFLYTGIGSFIYFELKNLMAGYSREARTEIWAMMDLATNILTLVAGLFITSRLATRFGLGITLAVVPIVMMIGLLSIAAVPVLAIVVGLQITRRGGNYAITRPAREMLFTYVDKETRFKAKQVIDVVIYRGGDVFWAWAFTLLTTVIGLGVAGVAMVGAAVAAIWAYTGIKLGLHTQSISDDEKQT